MTDDEIKAALITIWRKVFNEEIEVRKIEGIYHCGGLSFLNYSLDRNTGKYITYWEASITVNGRRDELGDNYETIYECVELIMNHYAQSKVAAEIFLLKKDAAK